MSQQTNRKFIGTVKTGSFKRQIRIDADSEFSAKAMLQARYGKENVFLVSPDYGSHGRHEEERQAPPLKSKAEIRASYEEPEHMSEAEVTNPYIKKASRCGIPT